VSSCGDGDPVTWLIAGAAAAGVVAAAAGGGVCESADCGRWTR